MTTQKKNPTAARDRHGAVKNTLPRCNQLTNTVIGVSVSWVSSQSA